MVLYWVLSMKTTDIKEYDEKEFKKVIYAYVSDINKGKWISSAKLKLIFRIIFKFYKSFLRCISLSLDYVAGLKCCFL